MNIFATNSCPRLSAEDLPDKLLVKMVVETAQILSTAHRVLDGDEAADGKNLYKSTHVNHPSCIWARETDGNYTWLFNHFAWLSLEYEHRYGREHKTWLRLMHGLHDPPGQIACGSITPMPACMPDEYKVDGDDDGLPVFSYRKYLSQGKSYVTSADAWSKARQVPSWYGQ